MLVCVVLPACASGCLFAFRPSGLLALLQGVAAAASTSAWLQSHPFASDEELAACGHLLWWTGQDSSGIPVLHIAIGRAVNECRGPAAVAFANAIVTQLQRAVEGMLGE